MFVYGKSSEEEKNAINKEVVHSLQFILANKLNKKRIEINRL